MKLCFFFKGQSPVQVKSLGVLFVAVLRFSFLNDLHDSLLH